MNTRHRWAAALVTAALLAGLTACADRPGSAGPPPSAAPSQEGAVDQELTSTVEVTGTLSELADTQGEAYILNLDGEGFVPVRFAEDLTVDLRAAGLTIAVPADFDTTLRGTALFDALDALARQLDDALTIVAIRGGAQR